MQQIIFDNLPKNIQLKILSYCTLKDQSIFGRTAKKSQQLFKLNIDFNLNNLFSISNKDDFFLKNPTYYENSKILLKYLHGYNTNYNGFYFYLFDEMPQAKEYKKYNNCFIIVNYNAIKNANSPLVYLCTQERLEQITVNDEKKLCEIFLKLEKKHKDINIIDRKLMISHSNITSTLSFKDDMIKPCYDSIKIELKSFFTEFSGVEKNLINYKKSIFFMKKLLLKNFSREQKYYFIELFYSDFLDQKISEYVIMNKGKIFKNKEKKINFNITMPKEYLENYGVPWKFVMLHYSIFPIPASQVNIDDFFNAIFFQVFSSKNTCDISFFKYHSFFENLFKKRCDLHLMSNFEPNQKNDFKNCYVVSTYETNQKSPVIYYFNEKGKYKQVTIKDTNKFNVDLIKLTNNQQNKKISLSSEQIHSLITSNGGHAQMRDKDKKIDNNKKSCAIF